MARADAAWVLIGSLLLPLTAQAQATNVTNPCDPRLMPQAADPLGYGRRGERWEGLWSASGTDRTRSLWLLANAETRQEHWIVGRN